MNKKDFSKNCLSEALIDLLKEEEFADISIQDIVDKAGFSRMAYYRNFKNKEEVLEYYVNNFFDNFVKKMQLSFRRMGVEKFFIALFSFLSSEESANLTRLLIKRGLISHLYKYFIDRAQGGFLPGQEKYFYDFIAGGIFSVFIAWLLNDFKETPEKMAEQAVNFMNVLKKN